MNTSSLLDGLVHHPMVEGCSTLLFAMMAIFMNMTKPKCTFSVL